ncbi:MAG: efflux RND transporter periplasmic adaptor subunit [Candidatus Paceibacterota bacterium]
MQSKLEKIKSYVSQKQVYVPAIIILVILAIFLFRNGENVTITKVESNSGNLMQTVKATGQVTSVTDLNLSFKKPGIVRTVSVDVGSRVKKGQVLASLSAGSEGADLSRARANVALAEAKLKKILEGATSEEVTLARVSLENAKSDLINASNTQDTLIRNAYSNLLNSNIEAVSANSNDNKTPPTISGTYNLGKEGSISLSIYNTGSGVLYSLSGLVSGTGTVSTTNPQRIGDSGLYVIFPSSNDMAGSTWIIDIPNKKAANYLSNKNAYDSALQTKDSILSSAQSLVNQREAELAIKQANARGSDIALGEAEVLSAKAGLQQAGANYEDTLIRAPQDGTVTKVNIKYGEVAEANKTSIILQDISNLYVEALINESNIANIVIGQPVEISFDALGDLNKFTGVVSHIDPSSETSEGIVNYKIKVSINEQNPNIRPGMNSEIVITTLNKPEVLSIPKAAIVEREGKSYVSVLIDEKGKKYKEVEVTTGVSGDGNMVEVLSGITSSDNIAIVVKN